MQKNLNSLTTKVKEVIRRKSTVVLNQTLIKKLIPVQTIIPKMYDLLKLHKSNNFTHMNCLNG